MRSTLRTLWERGQAWLPEALALLAGFLYAWQTWIFAHSQRSRLDEGLYMVKGYYFAIGRYWPFQDYGPLTNHMPLSFIIPGYIQKWFGPGMREGRYFAIFLSLLALLGLWLAARRLGGRWWAAAAVGAMALNTAIIKVYSIGLSQVLIAAMLAWVLALSVGEQVPPWQHVLAGALAGLLFMTRINLAPVLPFLVLFLFWHYGWRRGLAAALAGGALVLILHAIYWPGILRMWAYWLPQGSLALLEPWYAPWRKSFQMTYRPLNEWIGDLLALEWNPITAFWLGLRFNFLAVAGVFTTLLLWPRRRRWLSEHRFRLTITLTALFLLLFFAHMWAALGGRSCSFFCFSGYLSFFYILGLLILVAAAGSWARDLPPWRQIIIALFLMLFVAGLAYGASAEIGRVLAELPVPRISGGQLQPGSIELWGIFANRFDLTYQEARRVVPALFGLALGFLIFAAAAPLLLFLLRRRALSQSNLGTLAMTVLLVLGYVLGPTVVLGGGEHTHDCRGDVIAAYEQAGEQLGERVKPGMQVYWRAGNSTLPLLYIPTAQINPAQMNDVFSFQNTGDPVDVDVLERYGLWNEELRARWIAEADVILVEGRRYDEWRERIEAGEFLQIDTTVPMEPCRRDDSRVVILYPNPDFEALP